MNTRNTLSILALSLGLGCVGAPDAADLEEVAQTQHALTYSVAPASSLLDGAQLQIARATITGFTPGTAAAGTRISLRGMSFDRNRQGRATLYGLGYTISFAGLNGARVAAVNPVLVSTTEIAVTVPAGAATGRVRFADALGSFAESPVDFVVPLPPPPPAPTRVRVTNSNQYDLVALVVNGTQVRGCANPLAPGASVDVNVMPGGFAVGAVLGFCTQGAPVSIPPSHLEFTGTVGNGVTFTVHANPFTLGDLLTNWGSNSGEWASGLYTDAQGAFHQNSLIFDSVARWTGYDRGTAWGGGQATVISWPNRANCVSFRLGANFAATQTCLPFSGFTQDGINHVRR
ncbi:MAG: hypothetical protein U0325_24810 [Polyangiales bacterium]